MVLCSADGAGNADIDKQLFYVKICKTSGNYFYTFVNKTMNPKLLITVFIMLISCCALKAQIISDEQQVRDVLTAQIVAWNGGDISAFMQGYAKTDSIMFIGSKGVTYGWDSTLAHYKKNYPNKAAMGVLSFDVIKVKRLSPDYFFIVGKFTLIRDRDTPTGHFDLLFQKINGSWVIVSDHTS